MKPLNIFLPVIVIFSLIACKKPKGDDLSGTTELNGSIYYNDTLRSVSGETPLAGLAIQLKNPEDSNNANFIYQVTSNSLGSFTFTNLSDRNYLLSAQKEIDNLLFSSSVLVAPGTTTTKMILYPDLKKYNLIYITTRDFATSGRLSNTTVCLFTSQLLAQNNQCTGSFISKPTDAFGRVFFDHLLPGTYYINAQNISGPVNISVKDQVQVTGTTGLFTKTVYLQ